MVAIDDFFRIPNGVFKLFGVELNKIISAPMKKLHRIRVMIIMGFGITLTSIFLILCSVSIIKNVNSKESFFNKATFNLVVVGES